MASTQPSSAPVSNTQRHVQTGQQKRHRLFVILLCLTIIAVLIGWQIVSTRDNTTDPTVEGRPLSNPQMHLHTVMIGEKPGTLYLGTHYGIFTSTDDGRTWPQAPCCHVGIRVPSRAKTMGRHGMCFPVYRAMYISFDTLAASKTTPATIFCATEQGLYSC